DLDVDRGIHGEEHVGGVLLFHQLEQAVHGHCIVSGCFGYVRAGWTRGRQSRLGVPVHPTHNRANYSPRSSSLIPVFERVCASTRLTITAQYRLYLPSADGRLPDTTTEPDGTRP